MIFKEDPYISPHHATFYYKDQQLMVKDEMSLNGIFIRLNRSVDVDMNEVFVAGEQMFMVEMDLNPLPTLTNVEKDTRFFANSQNNNPNAVKRLTHLLEGGQRGICVPFIENSLSIGRQGCDLNFPQDRFMSSRHCHVSLENERVILTDMGSRNGTFVQVKGETAVSIGDFLLIGKQLLQVQPHQPEAQAHISI
jgi:pSer/pThr/pTyr-binding forkhead associated (FHA) protein